MLRTLSLVAAIVTGYLLADLPNPTAPDPNSPRPIEAVDSVFIEDLTWMEVRDALRAGKDTVIVATGGIEQNGPYLVTGKHNVVLAGHDRGDCPQAGQHPGGPDRGVRAGGGHRPADACT